mmetsp:Transcript_128501/g.227604  ORF Transcript_128501/g.227604 Transcript_128501/m.227604 type:complete len:82 (-) Transcript_128501:86-331(-)
MQNSYENSSPCLALLTSCGGNLIKQHLAGFFHRCSEGLSGGAFTQVLLELFHPRQAGCKHEGHMHKLEVIEVVDEPTGIGP